MQRLWVVMCKPSNNKWEICTFPQFEYVHINYYKAHYLKRQIQEYLKGKDKVWYKNRFKVVEFKERQFDIKYPGGLK